MNDELIYNPPPDWPSPPPGWTPPKGWTPPPHFPPMPDGWKLWISANQIDETSEEDLELSSNVQLIPDGTSPEDVLDPLIFDDEKLLQDAGIYSYYHPLKTSVAYKDRIKKIQSEQLELIRSESAITSDSDFSYEGSIAKGQKLSNDLSKLMLRAYNAEAENCTRTVRAGNISIVKKRLERTRITISKLGTLMHMKIGDDYHNLKLLELELVSDHLNKKKAEKEQEREERARLREERRAQRELEAEQERLQKEKQHLENAILALAESGDLDSELESKLHELQQAIEQNDFRIANIRSGYVYVISNEGAFGKNIVKIGLTRRLNPRDRITELSGAAVPFRFDVHALFFSEDAVTLENELHKHFQCRSVNQVNHRKEFFFASPTEVKEVLMEKVGNLLEYDEDIVSEEFHQSKRYWPE